MIAGLFTPANHAFAPDGGVEFATLTNVKGQSEYLIKGVDSLDGYKSLVIHCEEYSKCWGGTALN